MQAYLRRLIKPLLLRFFPQTLLSVMATEWHFFTVRRRLPALRREFAGQSDLLVNFGAGGAGKLGWVNVDGFQQPGINCLLDGRAPMPFRDASVRGFYSEHFFEHLRYPCEALAFLRECHRVMQPRTVLRLIVPDGEAYLHAYCQPGWEGLADVRPLDKDGRDPWGMTFNTRMEVVNEMFRQSGEHHFAYDFETLEKLLRTAGFDRVERSSFAKSNDEKLLLDLGYRQPGSLYVEAIR